MGGAEHKASIETGVVVARYNYICTELLRLNRETHQLFTTFVATVTILGSAAASILVTWKSLGVSALTATTSLKTLFFMVAFVSVATLMLLLSNVMSWLDYRREEHQLLLSYGFTFRLPPDTRYVWRWFEFWFAIAVLTVIAGAWFGLNDLLLPLIN